MKIKFVSKILPNKSPCLHRKTHPLVQESLPAGGRTDQTGTAHVLSSRHHTLVQKAHRDSAENGTASVSVAARVDAVPQTCRGPDPAPQSVAGLEAWAPQRCCVKVRACPGQWAGAHVRATRRHREAPRDAGGGGCVAQNASHTRS